MAHMVKLLIGVLALLALPSLSACNTARGFGQDIQAAGRVLTGTAEDAQDEMTEEPEQPATDTTQ